ncbi:hypothetical protein [Anaerospora hongkongensis]|uniref:hypothetical protein n=1 Tax=Anaerospora hongkongensis TaxID=244830 RepID=UPI002FDB0D79
MRSQFIENFSKRKNPLPLILSECKGSREVIEGTKEVKQKITGAENLQRKDWSIVEEGEYYSSLGTACQLSNNQLAQQIGVARRRSDYAINAYTKLSPQVQLLVQSREITEESTRALTKLSKEPEMQLRVAQAKKFSK